MPKSTYKNKYNKMYRRCNVLQMTHRCWVHTENKRKVDSTETTVSYGVSETKLSIYRLQVNHILTRNEWM